MIKNYGSSIRVISQFVMAISVLQREGRFAEIAADPGLRETVTLMAGACKEMGLQQSSIYAGQLLQQVTSGKDPEKVLSQESAAFFQTLLQNELHSVFFKHVSKENADLYNNREAFGPQVSLKFSLAISDIEEASKCLALERSTACVFHLMRVMERGVQYFGKKLGVKLVAEKTWQKILDDLNAPIKAMPQKTKRQQERKEELAALHAHLFNVKLAWRNRVMHPKASYSPEEAADVYQQVDKFMRYLAATL